VVSFSPLPLYPQGKNPWYPLDRRPTVTLNLENVNIRKIGQGVAQCRENKRLKLCGGQAYDRSVV
jgi:hypothetical protein